MAQMRTIGTSLDRGYREDLNFNFSKLESMVTSATNLSDEMRQEFLLKIEDLQSQINSLNVEEILALISQMEQAVINANTAATKADAKAIYAEEKGNYAKEQGDYAKSQGTYATEKGDYANEKAVLANEAAALAQQESANLGQMKVDVVKATQDANLAAEEANESNVATQQVTEEAQILIDNTGSVGAFVLDGIYKKNNIVEKDGSSWIAKVDTQNNPLPILPSIENTWWRLVAQKGATGEQGNSFTVNAQGLLAERSKYDSELEGFSFLATDVGELYFRQGNSGWSDGIPFGKGEPGLDGKDGTTYYTWIKYADTDKGVGMSDTPAGKKYMGIAYNKPTATKSLVASDYAWSLIQGPKGDPGETPDVSVFATKGEVGDINTLTTTAKEIVLAINEINANPTGGDTLELARQINSLQDQVTGVAKEQAYFKLKQAAQDRLENGNGTVFAHDMNGNIIGMTLDQANSENVIIRDGKLFMAKVTNQVKTVTDGTVFNGSMSTNNNGARRFVRTSNGNFVVLMNTTSGLYLYKSADGVNWSVLTTITAITPNYCTLVTNGTFLYIVFNNGSDKLQIKAFDYLGNVISLAKDILSSDNATFNGLSADMSPNGKDIHIGWSAKTPSIPNSFNIRYIKCTVDGTGSGTLTIGAVEQVTNINGVLNYTDPSMHVANNNPSMIIRSVMTGEYSLIIISKNLGRSVGAVPVGNGWGDSYVINNGSHVVWSPASVYIPPNISGVPNGRIWCAYDGLDAVYATKRKILATYSDNLGLSWTASYVSSDFSEFNQINPHITYDRDGKVAVVWSGGIGGSYFSLRTRIRNATAWEPIIDEPIPTRSRDFPSPLLESSMSFVKPLFIFTDSNVKVGFNGSWNQEIETPTTSARVVYDIPATDFVGLFIRKAWIGTNYPVLAPYVNDIPMETDTDPTEKVERMYKKSLPNKVPLKLKINITRATPENDFPAITRILGGRS